MARTAVIELRQQIEEVRREAFAAGYAAAIQAIRELASHPVPGAASAPPRPRGGTARKTLSITRGTTATPTRRRRARVSEGAARTRRPTARRPRRGANAQMIEEVLQAAAPRALRPAEIRKALHDKGNEISFTSLRHALSQLEAHSAAKQVGNSRTWRYSAGVS